MAVKFLIKSLSTLESGKMFCSVMIMLEENKKIFFSFKTLVKKSNKKYKKIFL